MSGLGFTPEGMAAAANGEPYDRFGKGINSGNVTAAFTPAVEGVETPAPATATAAASAELGAKIPEYLKNKR